MVQHKQPAKPEQHDTTLIAVRVRDVSPRVWQEARIAALRAQRPMGALLTEALAKHLNISMD